MGQNIYDDAEFFANYSALPRSVEGLEAAPEFPTLASYVGDVAGKRVVDLGCGFGFFCRWAMEHGARSVLGIDVSERMLGRAAAENAADGVTYERADLDEFELPHQAFDLAYSSLTLHYLTDLGRFLRTVHAALAPGGSFVFSCEHPIFTAPRSPGYDAATDGSTTWPLADYHREGARTTDWMAPGVVKQHRTIATIVGSVLDASFVLTALDEWSPSADDLRAHPEWEVELNRPMFLLAAAVKR